MVSLNFHVPTKKQKKKKRHEKQRLGFDCGLGYRKNKYIPQGRESL